MRPRVIPTLLVADGGLVKTVRFKDHTYIGDPINAVRLFNDMEVDEILVIDIAASRQKRAPNLKFIEEVSSESFMPMGYSGGVCNLGQMGELFNQGVEKIVLNHALITNVSLLAEAAARFGSQSVVCSIDVKRDLFGRQRVYDHVRRRVLSLDPEEYARRLESEGAGEILLYDVDRDGVMGGYDLELIRRVSAAVNIPLVACGGAGCLADLADVVAAGAAAAAAGSLFVYQGKQKGVLINYPTQRDLDGVFGSRRAPGES